MKKFLTIGTVIMLLFLTIVPAFADSAAYPVEKADFYVYVATPDGGLNFRDGPGVEYNTIIDYRIPDGVQLHITATSDNWGLTEYDGKWGWVALKQTSDTPPAVSHVQQVVTEVHTQGVTIVKQVTEVVSEIVTVPTTEAPSRVVESYDNAFIEKGVPEINTEPANAGSSTGMFLLIGIAIFLIIVVAALLIVIINKSKKN
ncbi:MAG: hypothetical protein J6D06_02255 [Clostridia bacterium]|nr:hypothetical protein [Clostridia bacterium]